MTARCYTAFPERLIPNPGLTSITGRARFSE